MSQPALTRSFNVRLTPVAIPRCFQSSALFPHEPVTGAWQDFIIALRPEIAKSLGEKIHLVSQYMTVFQVEVFEAIGNIGHPQKRHIGLFRCPVSLAVIAGEAGTDRILPDMAAAATGWEDVING